MKISLTCIGMSCSAGDKGSNGELISCRQSLELRLWYKPTALNLDTRVSKTIDYSLNMLNFSMSGDSCSFEAPSVTFLLSVCPVNILSNGLWSEHTSRLTFCK